MGILDVPAGSPSGSSTVPVTGITGLGANVEAALAADSNGTGTLVLSGSPALTTPNIDTPSAGVLTNCTGLPISTGVSGLGQNVAAALELDDPTGTGVLVLNNSPALITPNLGIPSAGTLTNCSGLPIGSGVSGLGSNVATALAAAVTGSGGGMVRATSPSITTPSFPGGVASVNGTPTIGNGVQAIVAKYDATAQQANISTSTVLYSVPSAGVGIYRVYAYVVVTQAASGGTPSSTSPNVELFFTDNDTGVTETMFLGNTSTSNTVGTYTQSGGTLNAKSSTNITFGTSGYGSSGTTPMQFAIHIRLMYVG